MVAMVGGKQKHCKVLIFNDDDKDDDDDEDDDDEDDDKDDEDDDEEVWNFCTIMDKDDKINTFMGLLIELRRKIADVMPISLMSTPVDGTEYIVEHFKHGEAKSSILTIIMED